MYTEAEAGADLVEQYRWSPEAAALIPARPVRVRKESAPGELFVAVRIPRSTLKKAVEAAPTALAVLMLIAMRVRGLAAKDGTITVPADAWEGIGLSRYQFGRGLRGLVDAGLVEAHALKGRKSRVKLLADLGIPQRRRDGAL